ncbi:MAG: hypothetical protein JXR77_11200, partial [Lentisphaeria bacterium]|nr:hypothetical protein [Lentisphaeria bacterium]
KHYCDLETADGMLAFCKAQCVNPSRIPAIMVMRRTPEGGFLPLENPSPGAPDPSCGKSALYQFVGLQTDYSGTGKGLITPAMMESVLARARAS